MFLFICEDDIANNGMMRRARKHHCQEMIGKKQDPSFKKVLSLILPRTGHSKEWFSEPVRKP
jgi:hypothetical protein